MNQALALYSYLLRRTLVLLILLSTAFPNVQVSDTTDDAMKNRSRQHNTLMARMMVFH